MSEAHQFNNFDLGNDIIMSESVIIVALLASCVISNELKMQITQV